MSEMLYLERLHSAITAKKNAKTRWAKRYWRTVVTQLKNHRKFYSES
jgi:hypothetical protein